MKNARWNCKLTMKFVKLYLSHECLWSREHCDFKNSSAKLNAYNALLNEMKKYVDIDLKGVKTKIKNLRCTYIQEVAKISKRSRDSSDVYESSLPWFKEMDRCLKNMIATKSMRPENKLCEEQWDKEVYREEHLDEDFLNKINEDENRRDVSDQQADDQQNGHESDTSDFMYGDAFAYRWSSEATLKFVKCYLKHELLWNPKHPAYLNKKKKLNAYKDIIVSMKKYVKLDVNGVRTKVRNLRSTYNQMLLKIMRKSTDPNHIYQPTMSWFSVMDEKLKDVVQLKSKAIRADIKWDTSWDQHKDSTNKIVVDEEILRNIKSDIDCLEDLNQDVLVHDDTFEHHSIKETVGTFFPPDKNKNVTEDEYELFGKYIAAQLRNLELRAALQAKADILSILTKARLNAT